MRNAAATGSYGIGGALVISEVYAGGAEGGPVASDFVELFDRGDLPVEVDGWSLQYAEANSSSWSVVALSGTVAPGQYFLVQFAGSGTGVALPTPDATGTADLNATSGMLALVAWDEALTEAEPALGGLIVDAVGSGGADWHEGEDPAASPSSANSLARLQGGFTDTDENGDDFAAGTPTPNNSGTFHADHVNVPPFLMVPAYQTYPVDDALTFSLGEDGLVFVDDADAAGEPIQLMLSTTNGTLSLSGTAGLTFSMGDGTADQWMAFAGTVSAIQSALDGMTYAPPTGYEGNVTLYVTANDLGNNGSGGAQGQTAQVHLSFGRAVNVELTDGLAVEELLDPAQFSVVRSGDDTAALDVTYSVGGTATFGTDYALYVGTTQLTSPFGTLTIPAGEWSVEIDVVPVDDGIDEPLGETIEFALTGVGAGSFLGRHTVAAPFIRDTSYGLDKTKLPQGNNHLAAHALATGSGVRVGVVESAFDGENIWMGVDEDIADVSGRLKINREFLFEQPVPKVTAQTPNPAGRQVPRNTSDHANLVTAIIAGNNARWTGVAKDADVYATFATKNESFFVALDALYSRADKVSLYNMSFNTDNSAGLDVRDFIDWSAHARDTLSVVSAGNSGRDLSYPTDSYNNVSVGAVGKDFQTRASYSAYQTSLDFATEEGRGLPHVLAPGGEEGGLMSSGRWGKGAAGTSFAAPHVTGIAALLAQRQTGDLVLGSAFGGKHLAYKAIIMNSARKRLINGPVATAPHAKDNGATKTQAADKDYLTAATPTALNVANDPAKTDEWTPTKWSLVDIQGKNYKGFRTEAPLDDEQGTGVADAHRALIQYNGGVGTNLSGKWTPGDVGRIGWSLESLKVPDNNAAISHAYVLDFPVNRGQMLTATLVWDKLMAQLKFDDTNELGKVERDDLYSGAFKAPLKSGSMPNFDLRIEKLVGNQWVKVAESVSPIGEVNTQGDTLEHLHFPFPEDGNAKDYRLVVELQPNGPGAGVKWLAENFKYSLAWWGPQPS